MAVTWAILGGAVLLVVLAAMFSRSFAVTLGVLALALVGGAAVFFFRAPGTVVVSTPPPPAAAPAAAPSPPPALPPAPAPEATTFSGRVLRGPTGEKPAAGASLALFAPDETDLPFAKPLATAVAGEDGRFRLETDAKKDGKWHVRASAPGLAAAVAEATPADPIEIRLLDGGAVAGTVEDAESKDPIADARVSSGGAAGTRSGKDGSFRLEGVPAGMEAVTATADGYAAESDVVKVTAGGTAEAKLRLRAASYVAGTIFAPDGKPAPGAQVEVEVRRKVPFLDTEMTETRLEGKSGPDGKYRVDGVPVKASLRVGARSDAGIARAVEVAPVSRGVPAEGVDLRLEPAATISVTVQDEAGNPVAEADVSVEPKGEEPKEGDAPPAAVVARAQAALSEGLGSAKTGPDGVALVRPVAPGTVKVKARKQDFLEGTAEAEAAPGAEAAVNVRLAAGLSLAGRVVDDGGQPIPEASVSAQRFAANDFVHEERKSGADGAFRIGGLKSGQFNLSASKEGFVPSGQTKADAGAADLVVRLQRGGAIAGVVTDPEGKAVPSFKVKTTRTDEPSRPNPGDWGGFMGAMGGKGFESPEGRFRADGLAPGVYSIEVKADGFAPGRLADIRVEASKDTQVAVALPEGITLRGVVVRKADDSPVAGARVKVVGKGMFDQFDMDFDMGDDSQDAAQAEAQQQAMAALSGGDAATTGADGRFELKGLEPGKVNLQAKAKELSPTTVKDVALPPAGDVRIVLPDAGAVEGTVYGADGNPVAKANIMVQKVPMTMKMTRADERGHYRVGGLAAGAYLVYVLPEGMMGGGGGGGFNLRSESIRIEEGKTTTKDFRAGEGTKVCGTVTKGGKPVADAMVMLVPGSGNAMSAMLGGGSGFAMAQAKADGTFEITGVKPGRYTLSVQSGMGGAPAASEPLEVPAGTPEVRRDIVVPQNGIRGVVVDSKGKPVAGAQVLAVESGKEMGKVADLGSAIEAMGGQARTDDDGRYSIDDMRPGSYTLHVSAEGLGSAVVDNVPATPAGGADVRVVLEAGTEVTVKVVGPDGKTVAGAGIYILDAQGREVTNNEAFDVQRTGSDGRTVVRCPTGTVTFEAVAEGFGPGEKSAQVPSPGEVVVQLPRAATLQVTVLDASGSPVTGASVQLLDAAGKPYAARISMENVADLLAGHATGTDGTFSRGNLPAGSYTVRVAVEGKTAEAPARVAAGETKEVTVRLP